MIFVDMDGVLADFNLGYFNTFGINPRDPSVTKKDLWGNINSVNNFFYDLPIIAGAKDGIESIYGWKDLVILTACPKSNLESVVNQKRAWIKRYFGAYNLMFIPVQGGANKYLYMQYKGEILIDDTPKCIDPWLANGGVGVLHTSWPTTMRQLGFEN